MQKSLRFLSILALGLGSILPLLAQQSQSTVVTGASNGSSVLAPSAPTSVVSLPKRSVGINLLGIGNRLSVQVEQPVGNYAAGAYANYQFGRSTTAGFTGQGFQLNPYFRYYRGNGRGFYAQGKAIAAWQQGPAIGGGHHFKGDSTPSISSEAAKKNHFGFGAGFALGYKTSLFKSRFYLDGNIGIQYIQGLPKPTEPVKALAGDNGASGTTTTSPATNGRHGHHGNCDRDFGLKGIVGPGSLLDANLTVGYKF